MLEKRSGVANDLNDSIAINIGSYWILLEKNQLEWIQNQEFHMII